jgi:putative ABC transport system permease protein
MVYYRGRMAPDFLLSIASGLLILILACVNVAHLMLARNLGRTREWGLRAALGASSSGLKAPLLMEALFLMVGGTVLSVPLLKGLQLAHLLSVQSFQGFQWIPLVLTLGVALLTTSLLPMRWASRLDLNEALREGGGASASRGSNRLRGTMTVFQLALAFALLVGAGLSFRALERLHDLNPGYDLKNLHVAQLRLDGRSGENFTARSATFQLHVRQALAQVTGVEAVAMSSTRPLVGQGHEGDVWPEGQGAVRAGQHAVSPEYLHTLRLPLLTGRNLEESDRDACLVSASLARRCWGEASPLGQRIRMDSAEGHLLEVVGVVGEARMSRLALEAMPAIYTSLATVGTGFLTVYVRSNAKAGALRPLIAEAARQSDSSARLLEFQSLESVVARQLEEPQANRNLALGAGLLAAFLAGIGLTGTLAQAAARQKREWGIRLALGASPRGLFNLVFRRVLRLLVAGLALGALFAWALGRLLQHQMMGVSPADPSLLAFAVILLGLTGLLAGLGPALRAAQVNPAEALRSE